MNEPKNMSKIRKICVYCGSSPGTDPGFVDAARSFGAILAKNGIGLIYGGGTVGMMGTLAQSVLDHGGTATGVIPKFLMTRERPAQGVNNLIVTDDMHERKRTMFEMADAFVALPGGIGTLEELVEQLTWAQLGRHRKPILLANVQGFWDPLCALLNAYEAARIHPQRFQFRSAGGQHGRRHSADAAEGGGGGARRGYQTGADDGRAAVRF